MKLSRAQALCSVYVILLAASSTPHMCVDMACRVDKVHGM